MPRRSHPALSRLFLALTAAGMLSACAGLPQHHDLAQPTPASAYASRQSLAAPAAAWPDLQWWTAYGDPALDELIDEAFAGSPNVAAVAARLARAEATAGATAAASGPQLSTSATVSAQKQSERYLTPVAATKQGWNDIGRVTLDFSWELDFWGRNRAAIAAASSEVDATRADAAQARLMLASSVAAAYAELARLHAARATAEAALAVRSRTAELFARRQAQGLEVAGNVRQVESRRSFAAADLATLDEQLLLQRHRLAALVGAGPDRGLAIAEPVIDLDRAWGLPERIDAELIGHRPDVAAARWRADSAARRIDQASAAFYPNLNLGAMIGHQAFGLARLSDGAAGIGSVGPAISLPIFDGGRLQANLSGAEADYAAAVASYDGAVVQALNEVADSIASHQALAAELSHTRAAVDAARSAWQGQLDRYRGGLASYLEVLSAEDSLLGGQRNLTDLEARALVLDIALQRALGGGYVATTRDPS